MCMQCVAEGVTYVGGAVGALQVMKVRARHSRLAIAATRWQARSNATATAMSSIDQSFEAEPTAPLS